MTSIIIALILLYLVLDMPPGMERNVTLVVMHLNGVVGAMDLITMTTV